MIFGHNKTKIKTNKYCLLLLFATAAVFMVKNATAGKAAADTENIRVGIAGNPPFILVQDNIKSGIAYEIWNDIATTSGWHYTTTTYESVPAALNAMDSGKLDMVVGPISITSDRVKKMDLSQPFYYSGISIMSRQEEPSILDRIKPIFSEKLLYAVCIFLFILAIVGTLIWLAERNKSPEQFPRDLTHGVANGMWLAIVTMSTTGYGDRVPVTFWGRVIAGSWMVISIIFATTMVAGIASTLTLTGMSSNTITEASQLTEKKVAAPSYNVVAPFLEEYHAHGLRAKDLDQAYLMLKNKKAAAIIFDRPQLLYFQKTHKTSDIVVGHAVYDPSGYGFAFPKNSNLTRNVNAQLLKLREVGTVKHIVDAWIGDKK